MQRQPKTWPGWALTYLYVFRVVVVGACVLGAAIGWVMGVQWLLASSICVGIGELIESTYYIVVLRWGLQTSRL